MAEPSINQQDMKYTYVISLDDTLFITPCNDDLSNGKYYFTIITKYFNVDFYCNYTDDSKNAVIEAISNLRAYILNTCNSCITKYPIDINSLKFTRLSREMIYFTYTTGEGEQEVEGKIEYNYHYL